MFAFVGISYTPWAMSASLNLGEFFYDFKLVGLFFGDFVFVEEFLDDVAFEDFCFEGIGGFDCADC